MLAGITRFIQFAIAAAKLAVADAKLSITPENANRIGMLIGSGIGGIEFLEEQALITARKGA